MGSKVVGFRVPDDLAEELERVSSERGQTTAEFLRKLVDDELYPSKSTTTLKDDDGDELTLSDVYEEVNGHDNAIEEINGKIGTLTQDVNNRFNVAFNETAKLANEDWHLDIRCKDLEKFINRTIEECKQIIGDYEKKLGKLHTCPDCGASLHLHRHGEENLWHLECVICGYYSLDYKATVWKEKAGRHPIPVKEPAEEAK